jgi:hypothetical protein
MSTDPFRAASDALSSGSSRESELARPFLSLLPVTGASVSTFGPLLGAETISATDDKALRVDELQFDLGEGPCWDALASRSPVLEPDFATRAGTVWPEFSRALQAEQIGALFAFPLVFGPLGIGAVDLYSRRPVSLTEEQQEQAQSLSAIVSRIILRNALKRLEGEDDPSPFSRRLVHQATGMVLAQLGISAADAHLIIQARAFSESRPMREVATDIVERRIDFTSDVDTTGGAP